MTEKDTIEIMTLRITALEDELALVTKALLSLGSAQSVGGPPGVAFYHAWHEQQLNPPAETVEQVASVSEPSKVPLASAPQTSGTSTPTAPGAFQPSSAPASSPSSASSPTSTAAAASK